MKFVLLLALIATPTLAAPLASDVGRYQACLALVKSAPERAVETAQAWRIENGGVPALHCLALAQFARQDYPAALASFDKAVHGSVAAQDGKASSASYSSDISAAISFMSSRASIARPVNDATAATYSHQASISMSSEPMVSSMNRPR